MSPEDDGFGLEEDNNLIELVDQPKSQFPETKYLLESLRNKKADWIYSFALKRKTPYTFGLGKRNEVLVSFEYLGYLTIYPSEKIDVFSAENLSLYAMFCCIFQC